MVGDRQWVAGGELGGGERSAQDLKQIILNILQEGENVTKYGEVLHARSLWWLLWCME